jgi:hypothetical protein
MASVFRPNDGMAHECSTSSDEINIRIGTSIGSTTRCQLQGFGVLRVLILMLGSCKSRMLGLHNRYTHSFSIIDVLWFLLLVLDC